MPCETPQLNAVVISRFHSTRLGITISERVTADSPAGASILPTSQFAQHPSMPTSPTPKSDTILRRQISCELSRDPYSKLLQYYETYLPPRRKQGQWVDSPNGEKTVWVPDRFSVTSTSSVISSMSDDLEQSLTDAASDCQGSVFVSERFSTGNRPINITVIPPTPPASSFRNSNSVRRNRSTRSSRSIRGNRMARVVGESPTLPTINADYICLSHYPTNGEINDHLSSCLPVMQTHLKQHSTSTENTTQANSSGDSGLSYRTDQQQQEIQRPNATAHSENSSSRNDSSIWTDAHPTTLSDMSAKPSNSYETRPPDNSRGSHHVLSDDEDEYGCVYHSLDGENVVSDLYEDFGYDAYHNTLRYTSQSLIRCDNVNIFGQEFPLTRSPTSQSIFSTTGINNGFSIGPESRRDRIIRESVSNSPLSSDRKDRKFSACTVLSTVNNITSSSSITYTGKLPWKKIWGHKF
ncbi:uncharacterized protein V1513DRAFT_320873 [Lipomyces chichibuensis]|uniref:uncharacterized protein n=1 Tax=Lipomyces chichibuensis TaxID=1546026 RepID=UPI0033442FB1